MKTDYKAILTKNGTAQTNEDLFSEQPNKGERFILNTVSMENETHASTYLRLGIERASVIIWLAEEKTPALGTLYWWDKDIYIYSGERLIVRWNETTTGDRLAAYITGFREPTPN